MITGFGPWTDSVPPVHCRLAAAILIRRHLHPHAYADDTQIYGFCIPPDTDML